MADRLRHPGREPRGGVRRPDAQRFYWTGHNPTALAANLRHTGVFVTVGDGVPDPTVPTRCQNQFGQIAEADLHQHAEDFVAAARAAGVDVTYHPRQGIHDWRYWREHLADAIDWGFFKPVPSAAATGATRRSPRSGDAWGLRFAFRPAPTGIERLSLEGGRRLRGFGTGQVTIRTPSGCRFEIAMEKAWVARLPAGWRRQRRAPRSSAGVPAAACEAVRFAVANPN